MTEARGVTHSDKLLSKAPTDSTGNWCGKKVTSWQKPVFIALIILGVVGAGVAGVGFASFGAQQGWWAVGALSNLGQINSIIMMAAGGGGGILFLIVGIVGSVKNASSQSTSKKQLKNGLFTVSMIKSMEINGYKIANTFLRTKLHHCVFQFSNGQKREVYLRDDEISNFVEVLDSRKVTNNTGETFNRINHLSGFQPGDVLRNIDTSIRERENDF